MDAQGAVSRGGAGSWRGYLELVRPPNLPTAAADILAGHAVAGAPAGASLAWLVPASVLLYAGGVALNDVFDAGSDARLRPERPIPRGAVSPVAAMRFSLALMALGLAAAFGAGFLPGIVALALVHCIVLYNRWAKHDKTRGPLAMGACRALNLLLGVSVSLTALGKYWFLAVIPILYIGAVTLVSEGETGEGTRGDNAWALTGVVTVTLMVAACGALPGASLAAIPFALALGLTVIPGFARALRRPDALHARVAVKSGVLALVFVDAAIAAAFGGVWWGAAVALLFPASLVTSKAFQVA